MTTVRRQPHHSSVDRRVPLLIGGLVLLVTAILALTGLPSGSDGDQVGLGVAAPALAMRWPADGRAAYRVEIASSVTLNPRSTESAPQTVPQELRGRLGLRVFESRDGRVEVGLQMDEVSYRFGDAEDPQRAIALSAPFSCTFDGGVPESFRFPEGLGAEVRTQLEELVRGFQVTAPTDAAAEWTAVEHCAAGSFRAVYRVAPDGGVHKRKAAYLGGASIRTGEAVLGATDTHVIRSSGLLHIDADGPWLETAELEEELEIASEGAVVARVVQRTRLRRLDSAATDGDALSAMRVEDLLAQSDAAVEASRAAVDAEDPLPQPRAATAEDVAHFRAEIERYVAANGDDIARLHGLARLLAECPELALLMPEILADPELPDPAASGLTHALELAGTTESQGALVTVLEDGNRDLSARRRAIAALGGVKHPTPDTVQSLWRLTERDGGTGDLTSTALLALGAVGRSMKSATPERYAELVDGLRASLDRAMSPESALVALKAIGNCADTSFQPAVTDRLTATSPMVRAAAAQALGTMTGPQALSDLTGRLQVEPDGRVRAAIARSVARSNHAGEETFSLLHRLVEDEPDAAARGAMARYLVDHLDTYPDARVTLERLVKTETDRSTLAYVAGRLYRRPDQR